MDSLISPFAPKEFPDLPDIKGASISTSRTGLRYKNRDDLLVVTFANKASVSGVYTKSSMPSAPVDHCRMAHMQNMAAKILCVNAGNANAFTGRSGAQTVKNVSQIISKAHECDPMEVYQASTGVIGEKLDGVAVGEAALACQNTSASWYDAAKAIMTTDTFPKGSSQTVTLSSGETISIAAIAKGSGMIAPNMGTMLAFIFTDIMIDQAILNRILPDIADKSFNSITVDGDSSTSDTLQLFATGAVGNDTLSEQDLNLFVEALHNICRDLALQIVKDGEGISKFVHIVIDGAESDQSARKIGLSVANSPLVKTALAGSDANWGRIVAAIGKSGEKADRDKTSIAIGGVTIAKDGEAVEDYDETPVAEHMQGDNISIQIHVGVGEGCSEVYTTDLTHRYIDINADYRS